jgi:hypothetical protein
MAESRVVSSNVYPVTDFFAKFFTELPTDLTYKKTDFHKFRPVNSIESETIEIRCPKWESPTVYNLNVCC